MKQPKLLVFSLFLAIGFLVSNCGVTPLYYWGNYPHTFYKQIKKADEKAEQNHKDELLKIINTSQEKELRVPPGVYAELGFMMLAEDSEASRRYFQLEMDTYPESAQLMQLLIENLD